MLMVKKTTKKAATPVKAKAKRTTKRSTSKKVDYYPNRMAFAVAALAAVTLLLFGMIAMLNP